MDYKYIRQLLARYWKGETTLEEEQILRSFFSQTVVPDDLRGYRGLFVYEQTEPKTDVLGEDFDARLLALVEEPRTVKARVVTWRQRMAPLFKAAAVVAIVLTLSNAAQFSFTEDEPAGASALPRLHEGASVALSDTSRVDTLKQSSLDAVPQVGVPVVK